MQNEFGQAEGCATMSVWPDAARKLGVGKDAAYAAAHAGEIPVVKIGRLLRVPVAAFERMLENAA